MPPLPRRLWPARLAPSLLALSLGCGSDDPESGTPGEGSVSCTSDPRLDAYAGSLEKPGELGAVTFRFSDFIPELPSRGNNTFHVELTDASGATLSGDAPVSLSVELFMPDHGHGTSIEPSVTFEAGRYTLQPMFLFMPGVWRVALDARAGEATLDRVTLHFCVEG